MAKIFDWKCSCGRDSSTLADFEEFIPYTDERMHDHSKCANPICECGKSLVAFTTQADNFNKPRPINAIFDYVFQIWRKKDGTPIPEEPGYDHVCNRCEGPSELESCDAYGENHKCLNCSHTFRVC